MSSTMDHKFTLFPFTSTSVEAICCVVICFKAKQVRFNCGGGQGLIILLIPSAKQTVKLHMRRTLEKESTIQVGQCTSTMERWLTILYLPMRAVKFRQYSCRNFGAFLWNWFVSPVAGWCNPSTNCGWTPKSVGSTVHRVHQQRRSPLESVFGCAICHNSLAGRWCFWAEWEVQDGVVPSEGYLDQMEISNAATVFN